VHLSICSFNFLVLTKVEFLFCFPPEQNWLIFLKTEILQIFERSTNNATDVGGKRSVEKNSGLDAFALQLGTRRSFAWTRPEHKTDTATSLPHLEFWSLNRPADVARLVAFRAAPCRQPRAPFDPNVFPLPSEARAAAPPAIGIGNPAYKTTQRFSGSESQYPFHRVLGPKDPDPHVRGLKIV